MKRAMSVLLAMIIFQALAVSSAPDEKSLGVVGIRPFVFACQPRLGDAAKIPEQLAVYFVIRFRDLASAIPLLARARIYFDSPDGERGWNIDLTQGLDFAKNQLITTYLYDTTYSPSYSILKLHGYTLECTFKSGETTVFGFDIPVPLGSPPGSVFLISSTARELVTPYHARAINLPMITRCEVSGEELIIEFILDDPRVSHIGLTLKEGREGPTLLDTWILTNDVAGNPSILNDDGKPYLDGRVNRIHTKSVNFTGFGSVPAKEALKRIGCIALKAYDRPCTNSSLAILDRGAAK